MFLKVTDNDHSSSRKLACVAVVSYPRAWDARDSANAKRAGGKAGGGRVEPPFPPTAFSPRSIGFRAPPTLSERKRLLRRLQENKINVRRH